LKPVLLDTGVIVALLDRGDKFHKACADAVAGIDAPLITCEAVIAESCYLLRNIPGASGAILENVVQGIFQVPFQLSREAVGVRAVLRKYEDRAMDLADACLVHLANEFQTGDILTVDGDFRVYRWARNKAFHIMPEA
jgi:predicted nucleic acid-binding protein